MPSEVEKPFSRIARATHWRAIALALVLFAAGGEPVRAAVVVANANGGPGVVNGAFDNGLNGWSGAGALFNTGQQGVITDLVTARTLLWQVVALPPGAYVIGFDVLRTGLTGVGGPGTLPDTFFATLFFVPDADAFDPVNLAGFSSATPIADMDLTGVTALGPGAAAGPSGKGPAYFHITMPFEVESGFVAPVFELNDLNFTPGNSVVAVDNVTITIVPEPGTLLIWFLLSAAAWSRRRRGPG